MRRAPLISMIYAGFTVCICIAALASSPGCNRGPDISTPKAAASSFVKAMEAGDADALKKTTKGTDAQFESARKFMDVVHAGKGYQDALTSKFGDQAKTNDDMPKFSTDFADADEKIDGDKATVTPKSTKGSGPIKLVKDSDGWKVDLADMGAQEAIFDKMAKPMADALNAATKDVQDGKFKTADEASKSLGQKMMSLMMGQ